MVGWNVQDGAGVTDGIGDGSKVGSEVGCEVDDGAGVGTTEGLELGIADKDGIDVGLNDPVAEGVMVGRENDGDVVGWPPAVTLKVMFSDANIVGITDGARLGP